MKKKATHKPSQTDWDRVDRMQDHEIDVSETPEMSPEKFAQAIVRKGLKRGQPKESDSGLGTGDQSQMNLNGQTS